MRVVVDVLLRVLVRLHERKSRRTHLVLLSVLATVLASCSLVGSDPKWPFSSVTASQSESASTASVSWASGAAGPAVEDGSFETWRGTPVDIVGTWVDSNEGQLALWQLQPGGALADWAGDLDIAVGAIGPDETWEAAARGDYDGRWRESLIGLAVTRKGATGITYIRFAHESNGDWYDWKVGATDAGNFIAAWQRYRSLQLELFGDAKLVFSVNRESVNSGIDWRATFPGREYVDVMAVDYYNFSPFVTTEEEWVRSMNLIDRYGAPVGLQKHLEFAQEEELPFAVAEWSSDASKGESTVFFDGIHNFFSQHGSTGDGALLYEILFNIAHDGENKWQLYPDTRMPQSSERYRQLW